MTSQTPANEPPESENERVKQTTIVTKFTCTHTTTIRGPPPPPDPEPTSRHIAFRWVGVAKTIQMSRLPCPSCTAAPAPAPAPLQNRNGGPDRACAEEEKEGSGGMPGWLVGGGGEEVVGCGACNACADRGQKKRNRGRREKEGVVREGEHGNGNGNGMGYAKVELRRRRRSSDWGSRWSNRI